jgi:hypothetical protein
MQRHLRYINGPTPFINRIFPIPSRLAIHRSFCVHRSRPSRIPRPRSLNRPTQIWQFILHDFIQWVKFRKVLVDIWPPFIVVCKVVQGLPLLVCACHIVRVERQLAHFTHVHDRIHLIGGLLELNDLGAEGFMRGLSRKKVLRICVALFPV